MFIYKITNNITGKCYIGQTVHTVERRFKQHIDACLSGKSSKALYDAMRSYGIENFTVEQIDTAGSIEELNAKEAYWVSYYNSYIYAENSNGYNMTLGGDDNPMNHENTKKYHDEVMRTEQVRSKISNTMKNRIKNGEFFTPEHKQKIADKAKRMRYIHKDGVITSVDKDVLQQYLDAGWIKGVPEGHNDKQIEAMRLAHRKTVHCEDYSGNIIATFSSVKEAANWWYYNGYTDHLSIAKPNHLCDVIKRSAVKNKFIAGLKWFYD